MLVLVLAGPAAAATKVVTFDDLAPETTVENQYEESDGVFFRGPEFSDGAFPIVRALSPGLAHSGSQVADISYCFACEFYTPRTVGRLTETARTVSAYVGYIGAAQYPPAEVNLVALDSDGHSLGSSTAPVAQGAPFEKQVSVTAPGGGADIASFEMFANPPEQNQSVGFDDLSLEYPETPSPPDFSLGVSSAPANVPQGDSVEVPIDLNRLNGSNGNIALSVSGLPTGMSAQFIPESVPGTERAAVLKLTAASAALPSDYTEITITATPQEAAGTKPHSATKLVRIVENCVHEFRTDFLDVRSDQCMRSEGPGILVATDQTVRVDGLALTPLTGTQRLVIDKQRRTISSSVTDQISVALADHPGVVLYVGDVDWDLGTPGSADKKIFEYMGKDIALLQSLPVQKVSVSLTKAGKAQITPTFKLDFWPFNYFGAISATAGFSADNERGSNFNALEIKIEKLAALGIELKNVSIKWKEGGTWGGSGTITIRFASPYSLTAGLGIKEGDLAYLQGAVGNLNVAVSPGVYLQSIGFGVERNPFTLSGTVGFSGGPAVQGKKAVTVNGTFKAKLEDPLVFEVKGEGKLADQYSLGEAFMRYSSNGLFELGGKAHWDLAVAYVDGSLYGFVDGFEAASLEGMVHACIRLSWAPDPCAGASFIVSNIGIAACADVYLGSVGVGYDWGGDFDLWWGSCNLGPWRPPQQAGSSSVPAVNRFPLRGGLPSAAFAVEGVGAAPDITLSGPGSQTVSVSSAQPYAKTDRIFAVQSANHTTYVFLKHPARGTWTLTDAGIVPIQRIRQSFGLPRPAVHASVSGHGRARLLRWRLRPIKGQRVRFAEFGPDVRSVITTTTARRGSVKFRPADGPGGRRRIVALVEQGGRPRATLVVGGYRAPREIRPARPRRLQIRHRGSRLLVSWTAPAQGFRHALYVRRSDGVRSLRIVGPRRHSATLRSFPRGYGARVTVTGLTHANGRGPSASAAIAGVPPRRPSVGRWELSKAFRYARTGGFNVTGPASSVAHLHVTPGPAAAKTCGAKQVTVSGAYRPKRLSRLGRAIWAVGRRNPGSADGLTGLRVTVKQGHRQRQGRLKLVFEGARAGSGEIEFGACRLFFETRRR